MQLLLNNKVTAACLFSDWIYADQCNKEPVGFRNTVSNTELFSNAAVTEF